MPDRSENPKTPWLNIWVSLERKWQIKEWCLHHGSISLKQFLEDAIALAMGETKASKKVAKKSESIETELAYNLHTPEYREWVDFVVDIFNSGNLKDINSLIGNIDAFKRGIQFDELAGLLIHALKTEGTFPDESLNSAITEATDLTRALARARDSIKALKTSKEGSEKRKTTRTG